MQASNKPDSQWEKDIDTAINQNSSVLEVPASNWVKKVDVKMVECLKTGHDPAGDSGFSSRYFIRQTSKCGPKEPENNKNQPNTQRASSNEQNVPNFPCTENGPITENNWIFYNLLSRD